MSIAVALPRAPGVTEELLGPSPVLTGEDLDAVRRHLVSLLAPLAAELPEGERLVLDAYRLGTALRRPERCLAPEGAFVPSPRTCRRAVGVAALARCLRRRVGGPAEAVAAVLEEAVEDAGGLADPGQAPGPWWGRWYAGLGPGARAVVAAEATTWATQLWTALEWDRLPAPVVAGGRQDHWAVPGSPVLALRSRADLRVRVDGRAVLVVVGAGAPDAASRAELLFAALVPALAGSVAAAPGRVVGLWPAAGTVRAVPVDRRALDSATELVATAVATWVDAVLERRPAGTLTG